MAEIIEYTQSIELVNAFPEFAELTVYGTSEDPLFKSSQVKIMLGIGNIRFQELERGDEYVRLKIKTGGQIREVNFLTEQGLYTVIHKSRTILGKKFRKFLKIVFKEIRLMRIKLSEQAYMAMQQVIMDVTCLGTGQDLYVMKCNDRYKVGRSNDPLTRLSSLQTGNPDKITIYKSWPNFGRYERLVHMRAEVNFTRLIGEWFTPMSDDSLEKLIVWIDALEIHFGKL